MNKVKIALLIVAVSLVMTACEDQEKNKLDNRVRDSWKNKIEKNYKEAYKFLSPGWRTTENENAFIQRMNMAKIKWLNAKIKNKICTQKDVCEVELLIDYEYQFKGSFADKLAVTTAVKENWIMKDNKWYHVPAKTKLR